MAEVLIISFLVPSGSIFGLVFLDLIFLNSNNFSLNEILLSEFFGGVVLLGAFGLLGGALGAVIIKVFSPKIPRDEEVWRK